MAATIVGNLVEDPEVHFTQNGIAVTNLRVAVTQRTQQDGQWRDGDTSFFKVHVWRGQAAGVLAWDQPAGPMNCGALAKRRPSATSLANVNPPRRVTPRSALNPATASANGALAYQVARSASIASKAASRADRVARQWA
jgi:hypothetical protein